ncbi:hypothetical protein Tco_0031155 [Tanacetum coccineum]
MLTAKKEQSAHIANGFWCQTDLTSPENGTWSRHINPDGCNGLPKTYVWKLLLRDVAVSFDSAVYRDNAGSFDAAVLSLVYAACCPAVGYLVYCMPVYLFLVPAVFNPLTSKIYLEETWN